MQRILTLEAQVDKATLAECKQTLTYLAKLKNQIEFRTKNIEQKQKQIGHMAAAATTGKKKSTKNIAKGKVTKQLPKNEQQAAQKQLIQIHEKLFIKAQNLVQSALKSSTLSDAVQQDDLYKNEESLVNIEKLMNQLSDDLVASNSCSTSKGIAKFTDIMSEVYDEIIKVEQDQWSRNETDPRWK